MFNFSNCPAKSQYYDYSNKLVTGRMKDGIAGVTFKEFINLKPNICSFLVNDSSDHKKQKV